MSDRNLVKEFQRAMQIQPEPDEHTRALIEKYQREHTQMEVDIRKHMPVREDVRTALKALLVQGRQIWGGVQLTPAEIVLRLMVGVGDLARAVRDGRPPDNQTLLDVQRELGNIIFSTIRWIDDLGLDPLECLDLAIEAQEKFARSGRPR